MADHLTEEEQVDAIKRWWNENWLSVVAPVVLAIVAYTGWNYWTSNKLEQSQLASDSYQQLLELVSKADASEASAEDVANARTAAQNLQGSAKGMYADLASLISARFAVQTDALDEAEASLKKVSEQGSTAAIQSIARARLAKVFVAQQRYDDAISILASETDDATKSMFLEVRGDAYAAKGESEAAHTAYQQAIDSLLPSQMNHRSILQFKLNSTATPVEKEMASVETAVSTEEQQESVQ